MTALAPALGVLLVAFVGVDVFRTVLLPTSTGSVERVLSRVLLALPRGAPLTLRPHLRRVGGPLSLLLTVVAWFGTLLVGFALVYLPAVATFAYSSDARFEERGFAEALYLSGAALTTLGLGDVVAQSTALRFVTVVEAACGFGLLTAALGYLPAIYTVISELRTANQHVADLGAERAEAAADLLREDAAAMLDAVRRDVIAARQHLQRFPVLHGFHPPYDESVLALTRGALSLWVAAHFAEDEGRALDRHNQALEQALRRLVDQLVAHSRRPDRPDHARAAERFDEARRLSPRGVAAGTGGLTEDVVLLAELEAVLDAYAAAHGYGPA